jgi:hypothetical protein
LKFLQIPLESCDRLRSLRDLLDSLLGFAA